VCSKLEFVSLQIGLLVQSTKQNRLDSTETVGHWRLLWLLNVMVVPVLCAVWKYIQ